MNKLLRERDLIPMLALFPLLIVTASFSSAVLICAISAAMLACISLVEKYTGTLRKSSSELLINILVAATIGALIDLTLQAFASTLYASIGGYLPLLGISVVFFVNNEDMQKSDLAKIGKVAAAVIGFGALRELIGTGALFSQLEMLLGDHASSWRIGLAATDRGFLLALLPVGGLIAIGLIIATKNYFSKPAEPNTNAPAKTRRVRVTGPVS